MLGFTLSAANRIAAQPSNFYHPLDTATAPLLDEHTSETPSILFIEA
jgi:hypothetical protein